MEEKCIIARHVNGISLNDYEYILDEENNVKVFDSKNTAVKFLKENGLSDDDIEPLRFLKHSEFQNGRCEYIN